MISNIFIVIITQRFLKEVLMVDENGWPVFTSPPKTDVPPSKFETPVTDNVVDTVIKIGLAGAVGEFIGLHL